LRHCCLARDTEEILMTASTVDDAAKVLADPAAYTDEARLHASLTHLRVTAPVALVDVKHLPIRYSMR
jgi:hypothetical protein